MMTNATNAAADTTNAEIREVIRGMLADWNALSEAERTNALAQAAERARLVEVAYLLQDRAVSVDRLCNDFDMSGWAAATAGRVELVDERLRALGVRFDDKGLTPIVPAGLVETGHGARRRYLLEAGR